MFLFIHLVFTSDGDLFVTVQSLSSSLRCFSLSLSHDFVIMLYLWIELLVVTENGNLRVVWTDICIIQLLINSICQCNIDKFYKDWIIGFMYYYTMMVYFP